MVDPLSLTALAALAASGAINEGIKFIYGQAGEVLKRWRSHKEGEGGDDSPLPVEGAGQVLEGEIEPPRPNYEVVERIEDDLKDLVARLGNYANGIEEPDPGDRDLAETVEALRQALEVVYGQRITFKGEEREPSGPVVYGVAEVDHALQAVTGVRARLVKSGQITGEARVGRAEGPVTGVDVDSVGG